MTIDPSSRERAVRLLELINRDPNDWETLDTLFPRIEDFRDALTDPELILDYVAVLRPYQERHGLWEDQIIWTKKALEAVRRLGREELEPTFLHNWSCPDTVESLRLGQG